MARRRFGGPMWLACMFLLLCASLSTQAQQAKKTAADLVREGVGALAAANGEKPRYGGTFLGVLNEKIPFYDMHQTALSGIFTATAPAYNGLVRTNPYDLAGPRSDSRVWRHRTRIRSWYTARDRLRSCSTCLRTGTTPSS